MAIKHSDPRKLQDINLASIRFEQVVADAWATRHEEDRATSAGGAAATSPPVMRGVPGDYRDNDPTHQPFAELRERLKRH